MTAPLRREAGMVTAEFAVALPAFIIVIALLAGVAQVGANRVRACDLARQAARAASIGETLPAGDVSVATAGRWVDATASLSSLGVATRLIPAVSCRASALKEAG